MALSVFKSDDVAGCHSRHTLKCLNFAWFSAMSEFTILRLVRAVVNKKKNEPEKCGFYKLDIFRYNMRSCGAVACMYVPIQFSWGVFKISRLTLSIWREISIDGGKQENISQYEKFFLTILMNFNTLPITIKCSNFYVGTYFLGKLDITNWMVIPNNPFQHPTFYYPKLSLAINDNAKQFHHEIRR